MSEEGTWTPGPGEPSDASSPNLYLATVTWENLSENCPAEPGQPPEPWERILNCCVKPLHFGVVCYASNRELEHSSRSQGWHLVLPFLSDFIPSVLPHHPPHPSAPTALGFLLLLELTQQAPSRLRAFALAALLAWNAR